MSVLSDTPEGKYHPMCACVPVYPNTPKLVVVPSTVVVRKRTEFHVGADTDALGRGEP